MAEVLVVQSAESTAAAVQRASELLADGGVVVLPGEATYDMVAAAWTGNGVDRLRSDSADRSDSYPLLLITGHQAALDYEPRMSRVARRMVRRLWPGPMVAAFRGSDQSGLTRALSAGSRKWFEEAGGVRLEAPAHPAVRQLLQRIPGPLIAVRSTRDDARIPSAKEIAQYAGEQVDLILDSGPTRFDRPSTIVAFDGDEWSITQEGAFGRTAVTRAGARVVVFVCTGNTCRSPLAEGLFRRMLSKKLGCADDELADRGFVVTSAGLAAAQGAPASGETIALLTDRGIDLSGHASQPLSPGLLDLADHVYTMTTSHRAGILMERPDLTERVELLSRDGSSIPDPIGGGMDGYRYCETMIEQNLNVILNHLFPEH